MEAEDSAVDGILYDQIEKIRDALRDPKIWTKAISKKSIVKKNELDKLLVDFVEKNL